jgi:hypothetical protein
MADAPPKKGKVTTDWINEPRQERPDENEQRRKLWEALTAFIHSDGGNVVSPPGAQNDSALSYRKIQRCQPDCLNSDIL